MNEKKIAKPSRKKEVSEPDETVKSTARKTVKSKKETAAKKVETTDFVIDRKGELKPAKKTRTDRKTPVQLPEANAIVSDIENSSASSELAEVAGTALAEAIQVVEEITDNSQPVAKKTRKNAAAKKTKIHASSSDTVIRKTDSKTDIKEIEPLKSESHNIEIKEQVSDSVKAEKEEAVEVAAPKEEQSPVFKELAEPKLPALRQENRARLQIQSPNRIFFYWSIKHNPFESLHKAFPQNRAADYRLVIKLVNLNDKAEEVFPVEPVGSWWFNVESNTAYRAEIGFFAGNRPFVRLMYSNTVETPRSQPSPNLDRSTDFAVSANQFAEVLDASGYAQDAFDVVIAGDDQQSSDAATQNAFFQIVGEHNAEIRSDLSELRSALFALANRAPLESLRGQISSVLFARLEAIMQESAARLSAENILSVLNENFEFETGEEEFLTPVFGASLINFPRKPKFQRFSPISSLRTVTSR